MAIVKIGVVEDEMIISDTICLTLRKLNYQVAGPSMNYNQALKMIEEEHPDLLLLDINLGGKKDGIDLALHVRETYPVPVIFLTANSDMATIERAKPVKPDAFLVKPFTKEDLFAAIEIAISNYYSPGTASARTNESILVKDGYDFVKLFFSDICYMQSEHNYVTLYLKNEKKIMVRSTMQEMMDRIPPDRFTRISRSHIINHHHITRMETAKVILGNAGFPISRQIRDELVAKM